MRIQLLSTGLFPYSIGGIQKHSRLLLEHLQKQGAEVEVYHYAQQAENPAPQDLASSVNYLPFPSSRIPFPGHYIHESYRYSKWVSDQLLSSDPADLIYAQGFAAWAWLNQRPSERSQIPVIVNFHGLEMFQPQPNKKQALSAALFRPFVRRILRKADYVQSLGGKLTELLLDQGIAKDRILSIPIGIDADWICPVPPKSGSPLRFVFVGRYERRKGIEEIFEAISILPSDLDFRLDLIGPIPEELRPEDPRLFFHGLLKDGNRIKEILRDSDVLLCPSYSEGLPTVILEAMACGCAIVFTDVGAVREVADEQIGWEVPVGDSGSLASQLESIIRGPSDQIQQKKTKAVKRIEESFTWEKLAQRMLRTFEEITAS